MAEQKEENVDLTHLNWIKEIYERTKLEYDEAEKAYFVACMITHGLDRESQEYDTCYVREIKCDERARGLNKKLTMIRGQLFAAEWSYERSLQPAQE